MIEVKLRLCKIHNEEFPVQNFYNISNYACKECMRKKNKELAFRRKNKPSEIALLAKQLNSSYKQMIIL